MGLGLGFEAQAIREQDARGHCDAGYDSEGRLLRVRVRVRIRVRVKDRLRNEIRVGGLGLGLGLGLGIRLDSEGCHSGGSVTDHSLARLVLGDLVRGGGWGWG